MICPQNVTDADLFLSLTLKVSRWGLVIETAVLAPNKAAGVLAGWFTSHPLPQVEAGMQEVTLLRPGPVTFPSPYTRW